MVYIKANNHGHKFHSHSSLSQMYPHTHEHAPRSRFSAKSKALIFIHFKNNTHTRLPCNLITIFGEYKCIGEYKCKMCAAMISNYAFFTEKKPVKTSPGTNSTKFI